MESWRKKYQQLRENQVVEDADQKSIIDNSLKSNDPPPGFPIPIYRRRSSDHVWVQKKVVETFLAGRRTLYISNLSRGITDGIL